MLHSVAQAHALMIAEGRLRDDSHQTGLAGRLDDLARRLAAGATADNGGVLARVLRRSRASEPVTGLYIHGGVGRGKTLLMDMFFAAVKTKRKWRRHFHDFMQLVHARVHEVRQDQNKGIAPAAQDPIQVVADQIAGEIGLLCLDEFQVADITDAMILGRLFEALFERGVAVVATSNIAPDELYKGGLNRDAFLPSIAVIKRNMEVFGLDGDLDYRFQQLAGSDHYHCPLGPGADSRVQWLWHKLTGADGGEATHVEVKGREVAVPLASRQACRFDFADLCGKPLGAADYLAIARAYRAVFVEHVPAMDDAMRNEAKRFVLLIDTLYDRHVRLIMSAQTPPELLYRGTAHGFEFERTVSRLNEMMTGAYWTARDDVDVNVAELA